MFNKVKKFRLLQIPRYYCSNKEKLILQLPKQQTKDYEKSILRKVQNLRKTQDFENLCKSIFFFKDYAIPNSQKDPVFANALKNSYKYLLSSKVCKILMPYFMKNLINNVTTNLNPTYAFINLIGYSTSNLLMTYFEGQKTLSTSRVTLTAWYKLTIIQICKIKSEYHQKGTKQEIFNLERFRKSIQQNLNIFSNVAVPITIELLFTSVAILYFCGPIYFFNLLISIGLYYKVTKKLAQERKKIITKNYNIEKKMNTLLYESLENFQNVVIFNSERLEKSKYTNQSVQNIKTTQESTLLLTKMNIQQKLAIIYGMVVNLGIAIYQVQQGVMLPGDLVFLNILILQVFQPLFNLGNFYRMWQESFVAINELMRLLSIESKVQEKEDSISLESSKGKIEFENVNFNYPDTTENNVLQKVNKKFQFDYRVRRKCFNNRCQWQGQIYINEFITQIL